LVEEGGFLYDSDAYNDELPYFVDVAGKRHLVLPYAFDTNDMQFFHTQRFSGTRDFAEYMIDAFDRLHGEGAYQPKMMSIGLHLRIIGRPGRIGAPERILRHIANNGDAWIAPRRHRSPLAEPVPERARTRLTTRRPAPHTMMVLSSLPACSGTDNQTPAAMAIIKTGMHRNASANDPVDCCRAIVTNGHSTKPTK